MKFAVAMLLAGSVYGHEASQLKNEINAMIAEIESEEDMWKLSMAKKDAHSIKHDAMESHQAEMKFYAHHKAATAEVMDLQKDLKHEFRQIGYRMKQTGKMLEKPKYRAELNEIARRMKVQHKRVARALELESMGTHHSASMDNQKFKFIVKKDMQIGEKMKGFVKNHPEVQAELKDLKQDVKGEFMDIKRRIHECEFFFKNPKYQAEIKAIEKMQMKVVRKTMKALKWDDEGLKMWAMHMDNDDFKNAAAEGKSIDMQKKKFVQSHKRIQAELKDLGQFMKHEFEQIGERLEKLGHHMEDPKYRAELEAIGQKHQALNNKFKKHIEWHDEGLKMWTLRMDNSDQEEIAADDKALAQDWKKFYNSHAKFRAELKDLKMEMMDEFKDIGQRLKQTAKLFAEPKYKAEIEAIHKREMALWNKIKKDIEFSSEESSSDGEMWAMHMDNDDFKDTAAEGKSIDMQKKKFVQSHKRIQAELKDLGQFMKHEFHQIGERLEEFGHHMENPKYRAELEAIGKKHEALNNKFKKHIEWHDEGLKMWTLRMDNSDQEEIAADDRALAQDWKKFYKSHAEFRAELKDLKMEMKQEFKDIGMRLQKTAQLMSDPKYKAELEAIHKREMALWNKIKHDIEFSSEESSSDEEMWALHMDNDDFKNAAADGKSIDMQKKKFVQSHKRIQAELKDLGQFMKHEFHQIGARLEKFGHHMENPKYRAELEAIGQKHQALNHKMKKAIEWNDEGLKMWTLRMDNSDQEEIAADDREIKEDWKKFYESHANFRMALKDTVNDMEEEFEDIGHRLQKTAQLMSDPKYKAELEAIHKREMALWNKIKQDVEWDNEK